MAKKHTKNQIAYARQVSRIRRAYRELEKQGYRFEKPVESFLPLSKPTRVTQNQLSKLKSVTRSELRSQATAISPVTGKVVTGTQAFSESRSISNQKAAATRKANRLRKGQLTPNSHPAQAISPEYQRFLRERQRLDAIQKWQAQQFQSGQIIIDNVNTLINKYETRGAKYLARALQHEISRYGIEAVSRSLAQAPSDLIERVQNLIFYQESMTGAEVSRNIRDFIMLIRSYLPDAEEQREIGELQSELDAFEIPE